MDKRAPHIVPIDLFNRLVALRLAQTICEVVFRREVRKQGPYKGRLCHCKLDYESKLPMEELSKFLVINEVVLAEK